MFFAEHAATGFYHRAALVKKTSVKGNVRSRTEAPQALPAPKRIKP